MHYSDVRMGAIASQITSLTIVYSTIYSGADQRKHQSSASLVFVRGNSPETGEFPAQMASNAENVSIWWRHRVHCFTGVMARVYKGLVRCIYSYRSGLLHWQWGNRTIAIASDVTPNNMMKLTITWPQQNVTNRELCSVTLFWGCIWYIETMQV